MLFLSKSMARRQVIARFIARSRTHLSVARVCIVPKSPCVTGIRAAKKNNHPILLVFWPRLFDASMRLPLRGWRENLFQTDFSGLRQGLHIPICTPFRALNLDHPGAALSCFAWTPVLGSCPSRSLRRHSSGTLFGQGDWHDSSAGLWGMGTGSWETL